MDGRGSGSRERALIEAITLVAEAGWPAEAGRRPGGSRAGADAASGSDPGSDRGTGANTGTGADASLDTDAGPGPGAASGTDPATAHWAREQRLLDRMQAIAEESRHLPDAKTRRLIDWIREHQCPALPPFGRKPAGDPPAWNTRRVLIFTENREGTKRHLRTILERAIEHTERAEERIEVIDGLTSGARRKEVQRRFNTDPARDPLRILIATDAAREGLNFQAHCADLFHFDLPWNPGRIEQRNGRIDRKLQPAAEVDCHYFVLPQRAEDRVLEVLVTKTETIRKELGSLSKVIDDDVERRLRNGIRHREADALRREIEAADLDEAKKRATAEELEEARERRGELEAQIERCRTLLARFRAQGFVYHDLSRACLAQAKDSIPRVILLGRLCLYGRHAERLHEELVPVAARWTDPARRSEPLRAYAREAEIRTLALLDESLGGGDGRSGGGPAGGAAAPNEVIQRRLLDAAPRDVAELRPQLEPRAAEFAAVAERRLVARSWTMSCPAYSGRYEARRNTTFFWSGRGVRGRPTSSPSPTTA